MFFDTLESRRLMSVTVTVFGGMLNVEGTPDKQLTTVEYDASRRQLVVRDHEFRTLRNTVHRVSAVGVTQVRIAGNGGFDTLGIANGMNLPATLIGGPLKDILFSNAAGPTKMLGYGGDDLLMGGSGDDVLFGMDGNDELVGFRGADVFWGMAGIDTVSYRTRTDNLRLQADGTARSGAVNERDQINTDVEVIFGGSGADVLLGSGRNDILNGGPGNDSLWGFDGNDALHGDTGNDVLVGGEDADFINGGAGADVLWGEGGNDRLNGDDGGDYLIGGAGIDTMMGGTGADLFDARDGAGNDVIVGASYTLFDGSIDIAYRDSGDWLHDIDRVF
jgi:Ca2+-binding RTX toxin-like protein